MFSDKLQEDFATILRDNVYGDIVLCGDNGKTKFMSLFKLADPDHTKLGYGWDEFCKSNNFKDGDRQSVGDIHHDELQQSVSKNRNTMMNSNSLEYKSHS
ncbi:hypothetical protein RYX36_015349 [Vicia faba]